MIALALLALAAPAVAGQASPAAHRSTRFGALRSARPADPYRQLFNAQRGVRPALPSANLATQPKVVCGTTIVPADPSIDPKMAIPRRSDSVHYTLGVIDPPICNPAR